MSAPNTAKAPIAVPAGYRLESLLSEHPDAQLWRADLGGRPVALRLARYDGPTDPADFLRRMDEIAKGLGIAELAPLIEAGGAQGGFFAAEAWIDGPTFAEQPEPARLRPLIEGLARLHAARKWHGGITPSRLRRHGEGFVALQFAWSAWISTLARARVERLDGAVDRPPELEAGPRMASPGLDTYALAGILGSMTPAPGAQAWLARGRSPDPAARPRLEELAALL